MTNNATPCNLLAVYGTLRRCSVFHKLPMAPARLQFFTHGLIRGRLFWQRTYPALIPDRGVAQVELFRIIDPSVLGDLDRYEGYDPSNLRASLFTRNQILLLNPRVRAWVYFLNPQISRGTQHRDSPERHKGHKEKKTTTDGRFGPLIGSHAGRWRPVCADGHLFCRWAGTNRKITYGSSLSA